MANLVQFHKHQPERRRQPVTTLHCGCCCCCCCCLHTLGSIVCAAVAPAIGRGAPMPLMYYYDEDTGEEFPLVKKPGFSAVTFFWWITCFLIFLGFAYGILEGRGEATALLITGVIVLLVFPGIQLIAAIITMIIFACWPRPDKMHQLAQLGKITLGVVLGTVIGIAIMVGLGVGFSVLAR